jgi:hypothetical protein
VFDINLPPPNRHLTTKDQPSEPPTDLRVKMVHQPPPRPQTDRRRTANRPPLTNKETSKEGKKERVINAVPKIVSMGNGTHDSFSCEKDLLVSLTRLLGKGEMERNGGMWRLRIRSGKDPRRALRNAVEDFNVKTPEQRAKVHNRGAWLTDRYERCLQEIADAKTAGSNTA